MRLHAVWGGFGHFWDSYCKKTDFLKNQIFYLCPSDIIEFLILSLNKMLLQRTFYIFEKSLYLFTTREYPFWHNITETFLIAGQSIDLSIRQNSNFVTGPKSSKPIKCYSHANLEAKVIISKKSKSKVLRISR